MKNISEMQLDDICAAHRRLHALDNAGSVAWRDTDALFSARGRFQILCELKVKFLITLRERKEAGIPLQDRLFSLSAFRDKEEEYLADEWEDVCENWRCAGEQMEWLYTSAMEETGFQLCGNWAAQPEIMEWLSGDDTGDLYEALLDDRMEDGTDTRTYIREHFEECFFEYDRKQQLSDAHEFVYMNADDMSECESVLVFRSKRIGRILSYVRVHGVEDTAVDVLRDLLEETAYPLKRYISCFSYPYVSEEDSAYVVRVAVGQCMETGEQIDFVLFKPVILMYLPLIARLCTLLEDRYPQVLAKEALRHGK